MMKKILLLIVSTLVVFNVYADPNLDLAKAKNCLACHQVDQKVVGPAFKSVAQRYASDKLAKDRLVQKVMKGGGGVWGLAVMPANTQLSQAEAKQLVTWILSLK